ncbi:hypothetical protein [Bacillus sp. ISL-39]|uniref:hypothetical protein n=1 Tax=Bacillus sp. ISL-39 TaxID=2819124 RepID=UPI001BE70B48|nr:hypothetical protein [Bacillus sp. ISL-39]MBT2636825.1 hypothetical protein [Bacillus sp. ISL-39]
MKMEMKFNNDEEQEKRKVWKDQRTSLYWLLGIIYITFLSMQLGRVQAISDFNYSLHEMLYIPATLSFFLVPIALLFYIYFVIKYLRKWGVQKPNIMTSVKAVFVIVSLITIFSIITSQSNEISTGGILIIEQKIQEENKYFFVLNGKKIRVSRNEFHLVEVNREYFGSYVWNSQTDRGKLETIEPILEK